MITKNEIINKFASEKYIEKNMKRYESYIPKSLRNDFSQYIYLQLLEMNDDIIINLYKNNEIEYFIKYLIKINAISKNGKFHQKITKLFKENEITNYVLSTYSNENEIISEEIILDIYNKLNITEKYIINNYENKTQKEIADELHISQCWVSNYITRAKTKIKYEYKNNY